MPSGEIRKIHKESYATIGRVSNPFNRLKKLGKAGRSSYGKEEDLRLRGSAMNPRDHPYGGGEGKTTRGTRKPKDKWGNVTGGRERQETQEKAKFVINYQKKN
jgi:large subunit ribosomal protein L2